ncbi:hypothetical protein BH23PLA1_BH23PLA1_29480 [soil metagenome]
MATLEIHDGRGRVEYLTISRDQQVVFGADPKCDIVLNDPAALPFHGRLRWRNGRYKAEAFPEARALEIDGKRVLSSSFRQGSEIRIGSSRIFLITPDDGPADFEKTRIQEAPRAGQGVGGLGGAVADRKSRAEAAAESDEVESALRSLDRGESADALPPVGSTASKRRRAKAASEPSQGKGKGKGKIKNQEPDKAQAKEKDKRPLPAVLQRLLAVLTARDQKPGEERVLSSPIVIGLAFVLVFLALAGYGLYDVISRMAADRHFESAVASLEDGEYRNAILRFEEFVQKNPKDDRASKARVLGALAGVHQFTTGANPAWTNALDAAESMLSEVGNEPEFRDSRADLAALVLNAASGLADRARRGADAEALASAEAAVDLHDRIGGEAAENVRKRARFPEKLETARAAVIKAQIRAHALATMDAAIQERDPSGAYVARDRLIARYPDLVDDPEVLRRLRAANDLIREAVTVDNSTRPAETDPRPDSLGPPFSLVLRSESAGADSGSPIVYALAEGFAYGLDGNNGAPIWHVPVGLSSPFPPRTIGGSSALLVFDARFNDLVRLDGKTGDLIWRQEIGEPVESPPLILGNQIAQTTPNGRLVLLDLNSGIVRGEFQLNRPITQSPVADELGRYLYVLGDEAIAFVIERSSMECVAVEYLGHEPGSVACPPARLGNYFIVPENHRPESGRWSIFLLEQDGAAFRLKQRLAIEGWTWDTPASLGSVIWAVGDKGSVVAYAIGSPEEDEPFKLIGRLAPEAEILGPTFLRARTERELWVGSGRSARYDLDIERGVISRAWTLAAAGPALAPIQPSGRLLVLTQQSPQGPGATLWGVDPTTGRPAWRTILGAPWTSAPVPLADGQGLSTLATDGSPLLISQEELDHGGFLVQPLPRPGEDRLPPGRIRRLDAEDLTITITSASANHILVREGGSAELRRVELPAPLAATPLLWGEDLFVPGADGRAYLIDPATGIASAEPLIPPFDRSDPIRWRSPALLDEQTVLLPERDGMLRRIVRSEGPRSRLSIATSTTLDRPLAADPAATGEAVVLATDDGRLRSLSIRDLGPIGAWPLDAPLLLGPVAVADHVFAADASGTIHTIGPDGNRLWTITLPDGPPAGPPAVSGDSAWFLTRDGGLHRRSLLDGTLLDERLADPLPAGGPIVLGSRLVLPVTPGTVRAFEEDIEVSNGP